MADPDVTVHKLHEDVAAVLTGTLVFALGVTLMSSAQLVTGGTAGLSLLLHYATGADFGQIFFLVNLPFYALSLLRLGRKMTVRTVFAVALVSLLVEGTRRWIAVERIDPVYAAAIGGALMGIGLLILFRHRTSLGGINILAIYAQEKHGLRAGYVQLALDALIVGASAFVVGPERAAVSLVASAAVNLVLATNHRPGRYLGVS